MSSRGNRSNVCRFGLNLAKHVIQSDKNGGVRNQAAGHSEYSQWTLGMAEGDRFSFGLIIVPVSLPLLWVIFSRFVVPGVIESAYRGESLPFLNDIISGQTVHPVGHYLAIWERTSWRILGVLGVIALIPIPLLATGPEVQSYFEARYGGVLALKPLLTSTILALFGFALVFYLYFLDPVGYVYILIADDHWAQYASFISWSMAWCFSTWMLFKDRDARKPGLILLALGTFFLAMEEISWGQRILEFSSPRLFAEHNLQGETNLHNIVPVPNYTVVGFAIFLWSIVLPVLTKKWGRLLERCNKLGIPIVPIHLWPLFLLAFLPTIYCPFPRCDEVGEMFLALAIATLSLNLVLTMRRGAQAWGPPVTLATAVMIVTLGTLTVFLVQFYSWPQSLKRQLNAFATIYYPRSGMYRQAEMLFDYMNRHPHLLTPETRFRHGLLLMRMGKHMEGKEILEVFLVERKRYEQQMPESPHPDRIAGQVLTLLDRRQEAQAAFLEAIEMDRARLKQASDPAGEAKVRFSLAKTLLAWGDYKAASREFSRARALSSYRIRYLNEEWMKYNLSKDEIAILRSFAN